MEQKRKMTLYAEFNAIFCNFCLRSSFYKLQHGKMLTNKKCQFLTLSVISLFSNQKLFLVKLKKKKRYGNVIWFYLYVCTRWDEPDSVPEIVVQRIMKKKAIRLVKCWRLTILIRKTKIILFVKGRKKN